MANIEINEDLDVFDLETLITDGVEAKIPIQIEYGEKTFGAMIRPVTNVEWNNAISKAFKNPNTTNEVELLKISLYGKDGEQFPPELISKLPAGVSSNIMKQVAKISGIDIHSQDNVEMAKKMMGF